MVTGIHKCVCYVRPTFDLSVCLEDIKPTICMETVFCLGFEQWGFGGGVSGRNRALWPQVRKDSGSQLNLMPNYEELCKARPLTFSIFLYPDGGKGSHQRKAIGQEKCNETYENAVLGSILHAGDTPAEGKRERVWTNFDESQVRSFICKSRSLPYAATYEDVQILFAVILKPLELILHTFFHTHSL